MMSHDPKQQKKPDHGQPKPAGSGGSDDHSRKVIDEVLGGKMSPETKAIIDRGHIPDVPAEWS